MKKTLLIIISILSLVAGITGIVFLIAGEQYLFYIMLVVCGVSGVLANIWGRIDAKKIKKINGKITDKIMTDDYLSFECMAQIGFNYSSDVRSGTNVRTYIKAMPTFSEVYDCFMNSKIILNLRNKQVDICLSLFYDPYFYEICSKIKADKNISTKKAKYLIKHLLTYLANPYHYKAIVDEGLCGEQIREFYIKNDFYNKSKELIALLEQRLAALKHCNKS